MIAAGKPLPQKNSPTAIDFLGSQKVLFSVIPAKAGIQLIHNVMDPGVRRGDDQRDFLRLHLN
jgi:hypothetical protein